MRVALGSIVAAVVLACGGNTHSDPRSKGGSSGSAAAEGGGAGIGGNAAQAASGGTGGGAGGGNAGAGGIAGTGGIGGGYPCDPPGPAGCVVNGCPSAAICDTSIGCLPSQCSCINSSWSCSSDCSGGVCVPVVGECGDAVKEIAAALSGQMCTTIVRLPYSPPGTAMVAPKAWQVLCGDSVILDEAGARSTAQNATGFGQAGALLGAVTPADEWVFWLAPSDFGGVGVVSARSGLAVFGGSIVWAGTGAITHPIEWRDPALFGFGCSYGGIEWPKMRGFDLEHGTLDAAFSKHAVSSAWYSALPIGLAMTQKTYDAVVLLYPPTVGAFDPDAAEYVVLVNSGGLQ